VTAAALFLKGLELAASRARKLRRRMEAWQRCALRRSRVGRSAGATKRWRLMLRAHVVRQTLLRKWGLL
jgi:hypothetical protein